MKMFHIFIISLFLTIQLPPHIAIAIFLMYVGLEKILKNIKDYYLTLTIPIV